MRVSIVHRTGVCMVPDDLRGLCINSRGFASNWVYCHNLGEIRDYYTCKEYYLVKVLETKEVE